MPPPPPPSNSYLLVLDSDSSDDSEDEYRCRNEYNSTREKIKTIATSHIFDIGDNDCAEVHKNQSESGAYICTDTTSTEPIPVVLQSSSSHEEGHHLSKLENDQTQVNHKSKKLTKNQKKRRQRRRKKKASQKQEDKEVGNSEENSKRISFSNVSIREFPRAFSGDSVPGHGGWPLGMKLEGYKDCDKIPVDEFEANKQIQLRERWVAILSSRDKKSTVSPTKSSSPSKKKERDKVLDQQIIRLVDANAMIDTCSEDDGHGTAPVNTIYESRQWDYRSRLKNPLFGMVPEDERRAIFLETNSTVSGKVTEGQNHGNTGRTRSNSMGNHSHSGGTTRSRSNSLCNHNIGNSMKGKFNEEYNQAMVHHVRNELEQIRFERNKSGATGCNCRKLVVYLPPKDGSGGKKAKHRRLKPSKVVQELKKRHLYDASVASMSREQMEKILHKAVENESCCRDDNCFCVRNGIICQADACSCWHDSHVHAKNNSRSSGHVLSNDDIRKRCGNPLGTYIVDTEAIDRHRVEVIKRTKLQQEDLIENYGFICQIVDRS